MKTRPYSHTLVLVLCVLALFVAQSFGSRPAFVCFCGGKPVATETSHCHGPHGEQCHADEHDGTGEHSEGKSGDREDHQVVSQDVEMLPAQAALQVTAPQALLAVLPRLATVISRQEAKVAVNYFVDLGESPPLGVAVASTIVLLI